MADLVAVGTPVVGVLAEGRPRLLVCGLGLCPGTFSHVFLPSEIVLASRLGLDIIIYIGLFYIERLPGPRSGGSLGRATRAGGRARRRRGALFCVHSTLQTAQQQLGSSPQEFHHASSCELQKILLGVCPCPRLKLFLRQSFLRFGLSAVSMLHGGVLGATRPAQPERPAATVLPPVAAHQPAPVLVLQCCAPYSSKHVLTNS